MDKIIVTVLGKDRPGIIASVSRSLYRMDCNLQNVNQMVLQNHFAGFFIVEHPAHLAPDNILKQLEIDLAGQALKVHADTLGAHEGAARLSGKDYSDPGNYHTFPAVHGADNFPESDGKYNQNPDGEIFFITTIGPDQKGLVARFTEIIASYNVNVANLTAIFKGGNEPGANIMSYQVAITPDTDQAGLFRSIRSKASELGLDISIQHKNIFETINKI